jgi:PadR family transcriptional regulator, regulatory protein PadR
MLLVAGGRHLLGDAALYDWRLDPMTSEPLIPDSAEEAAVLTGTEAVSASVRKFQKELSTGIVSLALLALMAQADKPLYGYQISKELEGYGGGLPVKQGTLYPVLRSLEAGGLLTSEVEPSVSGPPRRYYSVTDEGRQAIKLWRESWIKTREFVDAVLEGHRG